ncbi:MAG: AraC family transcriptional regulator [Rhodopseudomonas palustris]|nr:MAG: AraC family transcriptional regulator [Rhodopseudomonas palustris]
MLAAAASAGLTAALALGAAGANAQTPAAAPAAAQPAQPDAKSDGKTEAKPDAKPELKTDAAKTAAEPPAKPSPGEPGKAAAETPAAKTATEPAKPADPANPAAAQPAAQPPAAAEAPVPAPAQSVTPPPAAKVQSADPFGEEVTLATKNVVILKGNASWDNAFESLVESLKSLQALLDKQGLKAAGNMMIVYTSTDDTGFTYQAEIPVDQEPKNLTKAMSYGKSPEGRSLKFVHRGSYDNMDNTYEAITNHLDEKRLEAKDTFIEEYITDPLKTAEDKLVINVYVPLK